MPRSARSRVGGLAILLALPHLALAQQPGYTNHAGNRIPGQVVALDARTVTLSNALETMTLPLAIFPETERRRLAADFGHPLLPPPIQRAVTAAEKAIARSRQRAAKGLCSPEESAAFISRTRSSLSAYLDAQLSSGLLTPSERSALPP